jgi:glutamyl-tRNA synthetase
MPVLDYRDAGYLPEAIINFVAFLGWNPGVEQELFTLDELVHSFSLDRLQKSGAIFNPEKLLWFNREYLLRLSPEKFLSYAEKFLSSETVLALKEKGIIEALVPVMRERIQTFGELREMDREGEFAFFVHTPEYASEKLLWKTETMESALERLGRVKTLLEGLSGAEWTSDAVKSTVWPYAEEVGRGNVLWPLRFALSGRDKSPDPFTIAGIIGKDETIKRIERAISKLAAG